MKPISVWYHCKLWGEGIPDGDHAMMVAAEQMDALKMSGLSNAASEIDIGVNGGEDQALYIACLAHPKARIHTNGFESRTEIPTLERLRASLRPGWLVLYHHTKGVTHPGQALYENWRRCMERACIWNWRECVRLLESGFDSTGAHWLTPQRWPGMVKSPFWGGTFWWATSEYLMTLPALPAPTWENRYEAESWIGRGPRPARVYDWAPHWPEQNACSGSR